MLFFYLIEGYAYAIQFRNGKNIRLLIQFSRYPPKKAENKEQVLVITFCKKSKLVTSREKFSTFCEFFH